MIHLVYIPLVFASTNRIACIDRLDSTSLIDDKKKRCSRSVVDDLLKWSGGFLYVSAHLGQNDS